MDVLRGDRVDVAHAALVVARVEFPRLDLRPSLRRLDDLATRASERLEPGPVSLHQGVAVLNRLVYEEEGFRSEQSPYDDFRNGLLNVVLDRRRAMPIALAIVYMAVAHRIGFDVTGLWIGDRLLLRVAVTDAPDEGVLVVDPFDRGRLIGEQELRALFDLDTGGNVPYRPSLLPGCSPRAIVARILKDLKLAYVNLRSFPQALAATTLLLSIDATLDADLRDRGLLAYQVHDYGQALRDLEEYLRRSSRAHDEDSDERDQIWERVSALRRRLASMN